MPFRRRALALLLAALLFGCGPSASEPGEEGSPAHGYVTGNHYALEWSFREAPRVGEVELSLELERASGSNAEQADLSMSDAEITVAAWMPAHAHGLPDEPPVEVVEPGHYAVSGLVFTMAGTWEVDVTVHEGDVTEVLVLSIEVQ